MIFNTSFSNVTVLKISVPIPTRTGGALTYNGNVQTPTWNYDSTLVQLVSGGSGTEAGIYNAVFRLLDTEKYMWEDKGKFDKTVSWEIERATISAVPSQSGTLTYTGNVQSPTWVNYDANKMTVSGNTSAIDADTYTIEFTPTMNYKWSDGSTSAKKVQWTIKKKPISMVPSQSGTLTYNGNVLTPTWDNYNPLELDISGDTSGTNAGDYTAVFTPNKNCEWSDHTSVSKNVTWRIARLNITVAPSQDGTLVYTGSVISPVWKDYDSNMLDIGGDTSGTNAGSYDATFTPNSNCQWGDGTTTSKTVTWAISKADVTINVNPTRLSLDLNNKVGEITVTKDSTGEITAESSDTSVATVEVDGNIVTVTGVYTGDIEIAIFVASDGNYNAGSIQVPVNSTVPRMYTVTADIDPTGYGTVGGLGTYPEGTEVTIKANPGTDYKFVGWQSTKSRLPAGYTELEYIEVNNRTRIPTGYTVTNPLNTRVVMDLMPLEKVSLYRYLFSALSTSPISTMPAIMLRQDNASNRMFWFAGFNAVENTGQKGTFTYNMATNTRITAEMDLASKKVKMGSSSFTITPLSTMASSSCGQLFIGTTSAANDDANDYCLHMNLYSFQVYENEELVRDMVPCKDSNGVAGMYDMVSGTFKTGYLTGSLADAGAGPEVEPEIEIVSTSSEYTFTLLSNVHFTAVFKEIVPEYIITATVNPDVSGVVMGTGIYEENSEVNLEAVPEEGYSFVVWTENGTEEQLSTENPYNFNAVRDVDLVANFEEKKSRLPAGYTELQYIKKVSGDSYLISKNKFSLSSKYKMKFSVDSYGTLSARRNLISTSSRYSNVYFYVDNNVKLYCYLSIGYSSSSASVSVDAPPIGQINEMELDMLNKTFSINGETFSVPYTFTTSLNYYQQIFGSSMAYDHMTGKLYSYEEYGPDDTLLAKFVPCKNSNGEVGIYDLVTKQFLSSGGPNQYEAGPKV